MLADNNSAYTEAQAQLHQQSHTEAQQQQNHYQHLREPGRERYLPHQLYHQQHLQQ